MAMPDHVRRLRQRIGGDLLLMPSVSVLVRDGEGRLQRRGVVHGRGSSGSGGHAGGHRRSRRQDPRDAFLAYQEERIPRTARVQRMARFFGELKHLDGVGRAARNALLQKRSPDDFEYFDFLYGYPPHKSRTISLL